MRIWGSHILLSCLLCAVSLRAQPPLRVVVVEGDGAINNIKEHTGRAPVVRVEDEAGQPLAGATVNFLLPALGAGGAFEGGHTTLSVITGPDGLAVGRGFRPNGVAGKFQIRADAGYHGQSATAVLSQTNAAPAASHGRGLKIAIAALAAGAVAGVVVAAAGGGKGGASAAAPVAAVPAPGGIVITPGNPSFGPPR